LVGFTACEKTKTRTVIIDCKDTVSVTYDVPKMVPSAKYVIKTNGGEYVILWEEYAYLTKDHHTELYVCKDCVYSSMEEALKYSWEHYELWTDNQEIQIKNKRRTSDFK
jgi:hypothetical protein